MKIVIAPDKFAGTLGASEAVAALSAGWRRVRPDDELVAVPMADGGEGTLDVVAEVTTARWQEAEVADARGVATQARWLLLEDGRAFVEAAQAVGLSRLPADARDPLTATSYGVGQLLAQACRQADEVIISLGGSATVDGGAGAMTALGHRLERADGNRLKVGARYLDALARIVPGPRLPATLVVASDVTNPLLGAAGAAAVFGPQKGAGPEDVVLLEARLAHWADLVERDVPGGPWRELAGAGAAGGLGFALAAFEGARIESGAATVARLAGLDAALADAAIVLTGEGRLDEQTFFGKGPGYVTERARAAGARVFAVAGTIRDGAEARFDAARELGPEGLQRAAELVADRAAELAATVSGQA